MSKYNAKDSSHNIYFDATEEVMDARFKESEKKNDTAHRLPSI